MYENAHVTSCCIQGEAVKHNITYLPHLKRYACDVYKRKKKKKRRETLNA